MRTRVSWATATELDVMGNVPFSLRDDLHEAIENHELAEGHCH
jgi:hypothetical protein